MRRGLFAVDIDGVLTDGTVSMNAAGDERKLLSYSDIDAVFRARREGLIVALVTGEDTQIARRIAKRLEADRFIAGCSDKGSALQELAQELGLAMDSVCFIGDSHRDAEALERAGLGLTPSDAESAARAAANVVLTRMGGKAAVAEGLELFLAFLNGEGASGSSSTPSKEGTALLLEATRGLSSVLEELERSALDDILAARKLLQIALREGGTVYTFGNGGSAAAAQHLAAEIMGFYKGSPGLGRAVALSADQVLLTALANDAGYSEVFARQIALHGRPDDVAVAFTTSGRSENVLRGLIKAREKGLGTVLVTGGATPAAAPAEARIVVPSTNTQRIQEVHELIVHLLCDGAREQLGS